MSPKLVQDELDRTPLIPLKVHLVSGKTVNIDRHETAWMLTHGLLVFQGTKPGTHRASGYDVIDLRGVERIEQRLSPRRKKTG